MKKVFLALTMLAGLCFAQEPKHLKIEPLPQNVLSAERLNKLENAQAELLELAGKGNKGGEFNRIYGQVARILKAPHLPIADDELLELRKVMDVQVCDFGIFDYYFCNSSFIQGNPTAVFQKTQGNMFNGFVFRVDDGTFYTVRTFSDGSGHTPTTYTPDTEIDQNETSILYKVADDLYTIITPSNGTCGTVFILK